MSNFQKKLIKKYKQKGWFVIKTIRLNVSGMPDLILLKAGQTIFIESKELKDTLSELQKLRIDQLIRNGFDAKCIQDVNGQIYPKL
jgi:Holliday junction resolvase